MGRRVVVKRPGKPALVAGGFCAPCVAQELAAQTEAVQKSWQNADRSTPEDARWEGPLAYEALATGDGRYINTGATRWENLPIPLRWAPTDIGAHGGAVVVGLIETLERREDGSIWGTGFIDRSSEMGAKAYELMRKGLLKGVSVDLDEMDIEVRVRKEILDEIREDDDDEDRDDDLDEVDGYVKVATAAMDDELMVVTDALLRAATLVDIPAFKNAYVSLVQETLLADATLLEVSDALLDEAGEDGRIEVTGVREDGVLLHNLTAAAPVAPPAAWFENPRLDGPTPITITDDGRIYGHAALWGTCHTGFANQCVTPPRSLTNYAWFRTGDLVTAEGTHIPVGKITMSTGHASTRLAAAPAAAHYDDTGAVAADVAAGEDKYGVWISGALRSNLTDEQIRELRAAPMSGDWRKVGGNLEMVALLAVNLPGFPVPRTRALVASGRTNTLLSPVPNNHDTKLGKLNRKLRELKLAVLDREMF